MFGLRVFGVAVPFAPCEMRPLIACLGILAAVLPGASSAQQAHIRVQPGAEYELTSEKNEGFFFFSTSLSGNCAPRGTIFVYAEADGPSTSVEGLKIAFIAANPFLKSDYPGTFAIYHSRAWPPGEYRLGRMTFTDYFIGKGKVRFPFQVSANKAVYLGRFNFHFDCKGEREPDSYRITISDESLQDIPVLRIRTPRIPESSIVVKLLKSAADGK